MSLYEKIENDMKSALKEGDAVRLSVLRMLVSEIRMFGLNKNIKVLQDGDVLQIVQKQIKQHKDSIEQFEKGKRSDLADKEVGELKILELYMPEQLSEGELETIVKDAVSESGAKSKAEMGKVMKLVMEKAKGRADGKAINQMVMKFLK